MTALHNRIFQILIVGILLCSCQLSMPEDVASEYKMLPPSLDFNIHVRPIISDRCYACHGPDQAEVKADLRLDTPEDAYASLVNSNGYAIVKGKPRQSELVHRILSEDPHYRMPTPESNLTLTARDKAVLIKWIEEGAEYKPHWAFTKPTSPSDEVVEDTDFMKSPIDYFVDRNLVAQGLTPPDEADKSLLLRRLSFDLIGLPPSPEEVKTFINDTSDTAYEDQVDRLISSPHYGEKMAMDWLDVARYADTHGYQADSYRDMSPWRDWVIKVFNENMGYDDFITWQLAGDLLPNATKEQKLATGFSRLHPQNLEGGIIDEEFRVAYVADRTDVLGKGILGLTLSCAKCHDHKYDPISQKNYYELYSFFNNVNETGQISWDNALPVPTLLIPSKRQEEIIAFIEKQVDDQEKATNTKFSKRSHAFEDWINSGGYKSIGQNRFKGLTGHFKLDNAKLENTVNPRERAKMGRQFSSNEKPVLASGKDGNALKLDGDAWLDLGELGIFKRSEPFSVGLHIYLPKDLTDGNFFHKGEGARLYSFRGFHLKLKDNKLELVMAHTWPDNAIVEYADIHVPREEWIQLTVTYDGSSKAAGYNLYLNGVVVPTEVAIDNLYKDILLGNATASEPGIQFGARWRGKGLGGSILDEVMVFDRELTELEVMKLGSDNLFEEVISKSPKSLTSTELDKLHAYYKSHYDKDYSRSLNTLKELRNKYVDSVETVQEVMVMKEMTEPRSSYVLERGEYDGYGEEVFPATPKDILPMPEELPRNRMGLARWLIHPDNPLTARVAVNRYWQNLFGRGLVETTEDFGSQGALPSHPDLLDWLAQDFMASGWDTKALIKRLVMSHAYRRDSKSSNELREKDPDNIWLARGPTLRLSSEMIRDNALAASGLLNSKIGGESVYPYQPADLWIMNNGKYVQDTGDKLYRRSMYTIWKRSVPHPTLATFDAPDRSECTVRRQKTNTPLQALVLLNDPTYLEAAKVIGERMSTFDIIEEGINEAFLSLTGRSASQSELQILVAAQRKEYEAFRDDEDKAIGWLRAGSYDVDKRLDPSLVSANAVVASVILNSDPTITKR